MRSLGVFLLLAGTWVVTDSKLLMLVGYGINYLGGWLSVVAVIVAEHILMKHVPTKETKKKSGPTDQDF